MSTSFEQAIEVSGYHVSIPLRGRCNVNRWVAAHPNQFWVGYRVSIPLRGRCNVNDKTDTRWFINGIHVSIPLRGRCNVNMDG